MTTKDIPSIAQCAAALELVGKRVRFKYNTEGWALAKGNPRVGTVTGIYFPDIAHPYITVTFTKKQVSHIYPFEVEVVEDTAA